MEISFVPKNADFYCKLCDFSCYKKSNYKIHLNTKKHLLRVNGNKMEIMENKKNALYDCKCGKRFKTNAGLWKHHKTCLVKVDSHTPPEEINDKELVVMLVKQNAEIMKENSDLRKEQADIRQLILELVKNGTHNTTNNNNNNTTNNTTNNTNSHNKAFNLNFFLNETCKNAMNINDFVDSIKLQLSDFMEVGEVGFVQGISNIIVKKLNALDETIRPIHCTDQKRETFYVKDENKWEKEEEDLKRIRKMIKRVVVKNERLMSVYKEKYPDYNDYDSNRSNQYSMFVIEALGGQGDNEKEKENKIINHISKATIIKNKVKK
jgi:hypothetical protein